MRQKQGLAIGEWAVLALLCERPAHGYAIASMMRPDGELGRIWSLGKPLTYRTIGVLRSMGLVDVVAITPGDQAPNRTRLRATPKGRRRVSKWLATPEQHVRDLRSNLLLKILFIHRRGDSPEALLEAQRDVLNDQADALRTPVPGDLSETLIRRWRLAMTEAALSFVEQTLTDVRSGSTPHPKLAS